MKNEFYSVQHRGFKLSTVFYNITNLQRAKLNEERKSGKGGQQSDVTVIMPSVTNYNMNEDDDYISSQLYRMQREVPGNIDIFELKKCKSRKVFKIETIYTLSEIHKHYFS